MRFGEKVSTAENTLYGKHVHLEEEIILWGGGEGGGIYYNFSSNRVQGNVKGNVGGIKFRVSILKKEIY